MWCVAFRGCALNKSGVAGGKHRNRVARAIKPFHSLCFVSCFLLNTDRLRTYVDVLHDDDDDDDDDRIVVANACACHKRGMERKR